MGVNYRLRDIQSRNVIVGVFCVWVKESVSKRERNERRNNKEMVEQDRNR